MNHEFDRLADFARTHVALENMRENMDRKDMAKEKRMFKIY